jgi:hypothetical protein
MDRVPDDQPLPPWAEEMLERAFVGLGSPNEPVDDAVVAVIAMDLTATLGWTPEQAQAVARRAARSHQGDGHPAFDTVNGGRRAAVAT